MTKIDLMSLAVCRVCGESFGGPAPCCCAACRAPAHTDCFAYVGGCAIFGCGSPAALVTGVPPPGWRRMPSGRPPSGDLRPPGDDSMSTPSDAWLVPESSLTRRGNSGTEMAAVLRCRRHLQGATPLDAFALLGQCWFAMVALGACASRLWTVSPLLLCATGLVFLAHLISVDSLVRMGWRLTGGDDAPSEEALMREVATARLSTARRSRNLLKVAAACLAGGLFTGAPVQPAYAVWVIGFVTVFPWFSIVPRWNLEAPLLEAVAHSGMEPPSHLPGVPAV